MEKQSISYVMKNYREQNKLNLIAQWEATKQQYIICREEKLAGISPRYSMFKAHMEGLWMHVKFNLKDDQPDLYDIIKAYLNEGRIDVDKYYDAFDLITEYLHIKKALMWADKEVKDESLVIDPKELGEE